jgi:hypothetical protein
MKWFGVLLALQLILDGQNIKECKCLSGKVLLILHHLFSIYILFGGYVFSPKMHMITVVVSIVVHYLNHRICPITVINNRMCEFPNNQQLQTLLNIIEPDPTRVVGLYYFLLTLAMLYDLKFWKT